MSKSHTWWWIYQYLPAVPLGFIFIFIANVVRFIYKYIVFYFVLSIFLFLIHFSFFAIFWIDFNAIPPPPDYSILVGFGFFYTAYLSTYAIFFFIPVHYLLRLNLYIFRAVLKFTAKVRGRNRGFSHISCHPHRHSLPHPHQGRTFVTMDKPPRTHRCTHSPWLTLHFTLGVVHLMGLVKCIMTCTRH